MGKHIRVYVGGNGNCGYLCIIGNEVGGVFPNSREGLVLKYVYTNIKMVETVMKRRTESIIFTSHLLQVKKINSAALTSLKGIT